MSLVATPVTLIGALAYYFGWRFTNARALYFGLDPSILGFSTQDYILRSVDPLFLPLGALLLGVLIFAGLHAALVGWLRKNQSSKWAIAAPSLLFVVGLGLFVDGFIQLVRPGTPNFRAPLFVGGGTVLMCYAADAYTRARTFGAHREVRRSSLRWPIAFSVGTLAVFWSVGDWADAVGRGRARSLAEHLSSRPSAILFSKHRLHLGSDEVAITESADEDGAYRFRYAGLRVLLWSAGKYFFLSDGWVRGEGRAYVVKDDDTIRVEFTAP